MFFTQEDYRKIEKWLLSNSRKDTDFVGAATPLKGNETVVLVQNGKNVKASVKDVVEQLFLLGVSDFVNITDKYGESYISLSQAIELIPYRSRKIGQVVTFLDDTGKWAMYQFQGLRKNQWNTLSLWVDLIDLRKGMTVVDSEDIVTEVNSANQVALKFADKTYNEADYSGLGRVYLIKNIVNVEDPVTGNIVKTNYLTQSMISKENTIYIIQYDYNLNGQTITIPSGCVLLFEGGSFSNGTIIGNATKIRTGLRQIFATTITLNGSWDIRALYPQYFGAIVNSDIISNGYDSTNAIQAAITNGENLNKPVYFTPGYYAISRTLQVGSGKYTALIGTKSTIKAYIYALNTMDYLITSSGSSYARLEMHNLHLWGDNKVASVPDYQNFDSLVKYGIYFPNGYIYTDISNISFDFFSRWAIYVNEIYDVHFKQLYIRYCHNGIYLTGNTNGVSITECEFNNVQYVGVAFNPSHMVTVQRNIFERIGMAAIYVGVGDNFDISDNYFEAVSEVGFIPKYSDGTTVMPKKLHADIIINGASTSRIIDWGTPDEVPNATMFARVWSVGGTIHNNSFQKSVFDGDFDCLIFASSLKYSRITDNVLWNYIDTTGIYLLGTSNNTSTVWINDVELTSNYVSATRLIDKIGLIEGVQTTGTFSYTYNIYSNDVIENRLRGNLANKLFIYGYDNLVVQKTTEKYQGLVVYTAPADGVVFLRETAGGTYTSFFEGIDKSKLLFEVTYSSKTTTGDWTTTRFLSTSIDYNFTVKSGDKFTIPQIRLCGGNILDKFEDTTITWRDTYSSYIRRVGFPVGDKIEMLNNTLVDAYISTGTGSSTELSNWLPSKSGITYGTTIDRPTLTSTNNGWLYRDDTLKKIIMWNGTAWVNMDGTPLA